MMDFGRQVVCREIEAPVDESAFVAFEKEFEQVMAKGTEISQSIPGGDTWGEIIPPREKLLEYFLRLQALELTPESEYIDIASCMSLFPSYVAERVGCKVSRQDFLYTEGIHEREFPKCFADGKTTMRCIGSDGCTLPLEDSSVDAITLHCSFEHFEDNKDMLFANDALRVLRKGGKLLIIPFYCGDKGVEVFHEEYAPGCQFHRYYDPGTFTGRVLAHLNYPFSLELRHYPNSRQIDDSFYCDLSMVIKKEGAGFAIKNHLAEIHELLKMRYRWMP